MARTGLAGQTLQIGINFFQNGTLFDPFNVDTVSILTKRVGGATLATLTPTKVTTGKYVVNWDVPVGLLGEFFDSWTWTAESGMASKTQIYSFNITVASGDTVLPVVTAAAGCRLKPTWVTRQGLVRVEDVGNGMGVVLGWEEARSVDFNQQVYYNVYFSDTRFSVLANKPKAITAARDTIVNIPPGNINYFLVRATEFFGTTNIDITEMVQIGPDLFQYPDNVISLDDLPASEDAYEIAVTGDLTGFPSVGELLIDTELIRYSSINLIDNLFIIEENDRAINLTVLSTHDIGATVQLWHGIEDGNSVIRQGVAAWHQVTPQNVDEIGEFNVNVDGYRASNLDILTTDLSASDENTQDFPNYDFKGYHRPSLQSTFSGDCVNSYVGGEFNGGRGFFFQDRNLARLDAQLQVTGEGVVLLRRKWTGKRCKCVGLRREHQRTRCNRCFGTGFAGGYDRFTNTRAISERFVNTQGLILVRMHPYSDDLKIEASQGLVQPSELTAWTITHPTIKDRDMIVRFNEDGLEEFRYECLDVTRNKLFFGKSGKQEFRMRRQDKTDIIYTFDVTLP